MPSRVWWRSKHTSFMTKRKSPKKETAGCGNVDRINCHHYAIFVSNTHKKVSFHLLSRRLDFFLREVVTYSFFFEDFPNWPSEMRNWTIVFLMYKVPDNKEPSVLKNVVQSMSTELKHDEVHWFLVWVSRTSRSLWKLQLYLTWNLINKFCLAN